MKFLLYVDYIILIAQTTKDLREHLETLESFCHKVVMQVNTRKTKVMVFSLRKKQQEVDFQFEGNTL